MRGEPNRTFRLPGLKPIIKVERDVFEVEILVQTVPAVRVGVDHLLEVGHDVAQHVRVRNCRENTASVRLRPFAYVDKPRWRS